MEPGAYTRGHGDLSEVRFIVLHHTAGNGKDDDEIRVIRNGRSDLPGPLCQLALKRNGEPHLVAVGVCWQAPGEVWFKNVKPGNGNWYSIGIEGISRGTVDDWTPQQREMYPKVVAALLYDMGLPHDAWIRHEDYQPNSKIDPAYLEKDWFAPRIKAEYEKLKAPAAPQETAIQAKYRVSTWLGKPVTAQEELPTPDGIGRYREYENGFIYWTPSTGACSMSPEMVSKYREIGYETSRLGYPTQDVAPLDNGGRFQKFQKGSMYWAENTGTVIVEGRIGAEWAAWNWERGYLGMPKADAVSIPGGAYQDFENGRIYHSQAHDARPVYGKILEKHGSDGILVWGFPKAVESDTQDFGGRYQNFEFGTIYYRWGAESAYGVKDHIMRAYKLLGYEVGKLGYPTSDEKEISAGVVRQSFEHGFIEVNKLTNDTEIMIDGEAMKI